MIEWPCERISYEAAVKHLLWMLLWSSIPLKSLLLLSSVFSLMLKIHSIFSEQKIVMCVVLRRTVLNHVAFNYFRYDVLFLRLLIITLIKLLWRIILNRGMWELKLTTFIKFWKFGSRNQGKHILHLGFLKLNHYDVFTLTAVLNLQR